MDVVYGSSAGSLVGAYFISGYHHHLGSFTTTTIYLSIYISPPTPLVLSGQLPYTGPEVYYDVLTTAGKEFIDVQAILRSCGLGIFDLRLKSLIDLFQDRLLDYYHYCYYQLLLLPLLLLLLLLTTTATTAATATTTSNYYKHHCYQLLLLLLQPVLYLGIKTYYHYYYHRYYFYYYYYC